MPKPTRATRRAAWTSIATAWHGSRSASGHLGQLRPPQVQGPAQRPEGDRPALRRGLDVLRRAAAAVQEREASQAAPKRSYFTWVDQFDTFGLGDNTPIATGNESDGYLALKDGKWVALRVPYPMGTYSKGIDGRIDDPNGGWKGRGLWATTSTRTPFHMETGKGTTPMVMHFSCGRIRWRNSKGSGGSGEGTRPRD